MASGGQGRVVALASSDSSPGAGRARVWRGVLLVKVPDEPGMLGDVALVMTRAGINIDSVYVTTRGRVVLGVDDLVGATQVAWRMPVILR